MELHQVRYFLAVAETKNFTRAAEMSGVTQPTLTRAIKSLEDELGGMLFHRDRRPAQLTELGHIVFPHLNEINARADAALREARELNTRQRTALKLGLMCTIAPGLLLSLIKGLRMRYPEIELHVQDDTAAGLHERLASGALEVAVTCHPESADDERLHRLTLFREPFVIAVGPGHRLAQRESIRVRDLDGEDYLDRVHCEYGATAEQIFREQHVTDRTVYTSDRDDWVLAMAAAGMGYAFLPEQCARHPDVRALPLVEPEIWREVSLVTVRGRPHSAAVGALVAEATRWRRESFTAAQQPAGAYPDLDDGEAAE